MKASFVFNGVSRILKIYLAGFGAYGKPDGLLHTVECHDVGINDHNVTAGSDVYGHLCKCPPGNYGIGVPQHLNPPEIAYGRVFIPLTDIEGAFSAHGREGIGIHGGGSDLPDPFAPRQGWEWTYGCLRLQNADLENIVTPAIEWIQSKGVTPILSVVWP
jgi:hypothetical protein